jgi:hypothetical protein
VEGAKGRRRRGQQPLGTVGSEREPAAAAATGGARIRQHQHRPRPCRWPCSPGTAAGAVGARAHHCLLAEPAAAMAAPAQRDDCHTAAAAAASFSCCSWQTWLRRTGCSIAPRHEATAAPTQPPPRPRQAVPLPGPPPGRRRPAPVGGGPGQLGGAQAVVVQALALLVQEQVLLVVHPDEQDAAARVDAQAAEAAERRLEHHRCYGAPCFGKRGVSYVIGCEGGRECWHQDSRSEAAPSPRPAAQTPPPRLPPLGVRALHSRAAAPASSCRRHVGRAPLAATRELPRLHARGAAARRRPPALPPGCARALASSMLVPAEQGRLVSRS